MKVTTDSFWNELKTADIVRGDQPAALQINTPWYIRVLLGFSGWIAALFLLGFVAIGLEYIVRNNLASIIMGTIILGIAVAIFVNIRNDFAEQFGLALSFAGQGLILFGLMEMFSWNGSTPWLIAATLQTAITVFIPNGTQRLIASFLAVFSLSAALTMQGAPSAIQALSAIIIVMLWLNEYKWVHVNSIVRPIVYGLTLALVELKGQLLFDDAMFLFDSYHHNIKIFLPTWVGELITGILLVVVVGILMARKGEEWKSKKMLIALLLTAAIAAVSMKASGISTGLIIILLGFSNGNRLLLGLGTAALLFYVSAYYYTLEANLLVKSEILASTGVILLFARWIGMKLLFDSSENSDA